MSLIIIGKSGLCSCDCATRCVVDRRSGMSAKCTKEEIEAAGFTIVRVENSDYITNRTILLVKKKKTLLEKIKEIWQE